VGQKYNQGSSSSSTMAKNENVARCDGLTFSTMGGEFLSAQKKRQACLPQAGIMYVR